MIEQNNDENDSFIVPNIETKLSKEKRTDCRNIVQEIRKFGVNQRQILYLIELLALELEERDVMIAIKKAIGENREKVSVLELSLEEKI